MNSSSSKEGEEGGESSLPRTTKPEPLHWAACCNDIGEVFAVSVGDVESGFATLLSNRDGDPVLIYRGMSVYVLHMLGAIVGASPRWTGMDHCHNIRCSREFLVRIGTKITGISKHDISDDPSSFVDLRPIDPIFIERYGEARYVNLQVKAQKIEGIEVTEILGLESLRTEDRQASWTHKPFDFNCTNGAARPPISRTMSQDMSLPSQIQPQTLSTRAIGRNFWIGSKGWANFFPLVDEAGSARGPTEGTETYWKRAKFVAEEASRISRRLELTVDHWSDSIIKENNVFWDLVLDEDVEIADRRHRVVQITGRPVTAPAYTFGLCIPKSEDIKPERDEVENAWWRNMIRDDWKEITDLALDMPVLGRERELLGFPWAFYASRASEDSSAREEVAIAAELALRMLDDLALMPGPSNKQRLYQKPTSDAFQVFAFTSEGPIWNVYICLRKKKTVQDVFGDFKLSFEMCHIWKGDVTKEQDAWILMSLVRQIHQWAITEFKDFVVQHLRKWNEYYERRSSSRSGVKSQDYDPETDSTMPTENMQNSLLNDLTLDESGKKRNRDDEDGTPGMSSNDLKRLRSLPHPWWGMHPLYRPMDVD